MPSLLRQPLPLHMTALVTAGLVAVIAVYCFTYSALLGRQETLSEVIAWPLVNAAPWYLAFEAGKRGSPVAAILAGFAVSLLLGILWSGTDALAFEATRRVPAALLVAGLLLVGRRMNGRADRAAAATELPLAPDQIEWVAAAGNYVEIRSRGRTLVERASLAAVERHLSRHGFVRIHRSTLVRRDRIARIRPSDVILADGTSLKTGKRYRAALAVQAPDRTPV